MLVANSGIAARWAALLWECSLCGVWFVSGGGRAQAQMSEGELVLPGAGGRHGDLDAPHADAHQRADLQQLERMVPQVASANCVCARPMRRRAQSST